MSDTATGAAGQVNQTGSGGAGGQHEDEHARLQRNWNELLQELRVTQTGIQILTGFLLTVPFSNRFADLTAFQERVYLTVLCGSVVSTALMMAPVAFHRILFRQQAKPWLVHKANTVARIGLVMAALTMSGVLFLIFDLVAGRTPAYVAAGVALLSFATIWGGVPWNAHHHDDD